MTAALLAAGSVGYGTASAVVGVGRGDGAAGGRHRRPLFARGGWVILAAIAFTAAISSALAVAVTAYLAARGLAPSWAGVLIALESAGSVVGGLWYGSRGWTGDRLRRYVTLLVLLTAATATLPLATLTQGLARPAVGHPRDARRLDSARRRRPGTGRYRGVRVDRRHRPAGRLTQAFAGVGSVIAAGGAIGSAATGLLVRRGGRERRAPRARGVRRHSARHDHRRPGRGGACPATRTDRVRSPWATHRKDLRHESRHDRDRSDAELSDFGLTPLRAARELGLDTVLVSNDPDRYRTVPLADEIFGRHIGQLITADTNSVDAVVAALAPLHGEGRLVGVMTVTDYNLPIVAEVARRFGLPGLDPAAARACRDKLLMRQACAAKGVAVPGFQHAETLDDAFAAAARLGYPCVVKPMTESASIGVTLCRTPDDVAAAHTGISSVPTNFRGQPRRPGALVEEYLVGYEVSVESVLDSGVRRILGVTDKGLGPHPYFVTRSATCSRRCCRRRFSGAAWRPRTTHSTPSATTSAPPTSRSRSPRTALGSSR